jgi:prepilin-type N-terminal cleavage/methylation domain-containing protein
MKERKDQGVSALELVVVVMIIGVLATIAVPNVHRALRGYNLQVAAQSVAQQLNQCRQKAVSMNRPVSIRIEPNLSRAVMDTNFNGTFGDAGGSGLPPDDPPDTLSLNSATLVSQDNPIVRTFTSRGELPFGTQPSTQTITVRFSGRQRVVTIDPRGAVKIGDETPAS